MKSQKIILKMSQTNQKELILYYEWPDVRFQAQKSREVNPTGMRNLERPIQLSKHLNPKYFVYDIYMTLCTLKVYLPSIYLQKLAKTQSYNIHYCNFKL